jgi:hypothetical protein
VIEFPRRGEFIARGVWQREGMSDNTRATDHTQLPSRDFASANDAPAANGVTHASSSPSARILTAQYSSPSQPPVPGAPTGPSPTSGGVSQAPAGNPLLGIVRHILTLLGGALMAKGYGDQADIEMLVGGLVAVIGATWSIYEKRSQARPGTGITPGTMGLIILCAGAILMSGCARFTTRQSDQSYDPETGLPIREVSTRASATTFFDSTSSLTSFRASQTDKTQSAQVGDLKQQASGTNVVQAVGDLRRIVELLSLP